MSTLKSEPWFSKRTFVAWSKVSEVLEWNCDEKTAKRHARELGLPLRGGQVHRDDLLAWMQTQSDPNRGHHVRRAERVEWCRDIECPECEARLVCAACGFNTKEDRARAGGQIGATPAVYRHEDAMRDAPAGPREDFDGAELEDELERDAEHAEHADDDDGDFLSDEDMAQHGIE